jgi:hypothetical protein
MPETVRPLLSLAREWGIHDDVERSLRVGDASLDQLRAIVAAVDAIPEDDLYGWLAGEESLAASPSAEYIAVTCLTMAADEARVRLGSDSPLM